MRGARGANRMSTTGWMCLCLLTCLCLFGCEGRLVIPDTSLPWNEALAKLFGRTVETISLDRKEALLLAHVDEGLKNPLSEPYFITGIVGCALWTVAYILFIWRGIKDRIHTLPMLAICLNLAWESMAIAVLPNPVWLWSILEWSWLVLDVGLFAILWVFGRDHVGAPEIQRHYHLIISLLLVLCFVGQLAFVLMFGDLLGFIIAFVINLVMSALFIQMYFDRREDLRGLSYWGGWLKMLGTACTSIQCAVLLPIIRPEIPSWYFMWFLYGMIFILDGVYVGLLWRARRRLLHTRA